MEELRSLKETVTHLFDAVRYSKHSQELEEAAAKAEGELQEAQSRLETHLEAMGAVISDLKGDEEEALRDLSKQFQEFSTAAVGQALAKLERKMKEEAVAHREDAATERSKAVKSLESYLASDPLPIVDQVVKVRLGDGTYVAQAAYECEGGVKYEFALAGQTTDLFHEELMAARLGKELKVPVRLGKTLLRRERIPGFERLDRYTLADAEASSGRVVANFLKKEDGAKIKIAYSKSGAHGFLGIEYRDKAQSVNVMKDQALSPHVDLDAIKNAMEMLMGGLGELQMNRVSLLRLESGGEDVLESLSCHDFLQTVLNTLGPSYRSVVKDLPEGVPGVRGGGELSLAFMKERIRLLGDLSKPVTQVLGLQIPTQ